MTDTPTPTPALTDEQIDGGYTAEGIALQIDTIAALWKSEYGDPRPVFDLIAAVVARAKREERERIATEVRQRATEIWPVDVFPCMDTPDWEVINATIRQAGYTPDRISAHVMRHAFDVAAEEIEATHA